MADDDPKKDRSFNWVELLKILALPLVTLIVGYLFNVSLNKRQAIENASLSERQAHESYVRLYADMMGRREEADSALRKDMFQSILSTFLTKNPKQPRGQHLEQDVLNTELLAYNFHESLDLGPLFKHVQRELAKDKENTDENLLWRLERVAREVKEQQLAVLSDSGMVGRGDLNLGTMVGTFGESTVVPRPGEKRGGPTLCMSIDSADGKKHFRQFKIKFLDFSNDRREVELSLSISRPLPEEDCKKILDPKVEQENIETAPHFLVGLFAFPMIDNTHLSHSERCSVSVTDITNDPVNVKSAGNVNIAVSFFQASRASLKDKLYYDEVLHDLLRNPAITEAKEQ
jgi:hypothetical protein